MIPTVPRFEEVFFGQTSFLELAEQLTYSYYMRLAMPRNGEDHDTHMRNWALDVFPLALMHLDEMYEHHGDALGEAINQEYTPKVGYGMFLTMNSDVLPLLDNWLNSTEGQAELSAWLEQHGFGGTIYPEELGAMLRYWATKPMETEQAAGLIERAVDAIVEHRDIPSPAMDERLALYRAAGEGEEAFQQWREGRELTLDSFKAALSAAVNADNAPLLGALLDELAASPMIQSEGRREVHYHCCELIRNAARNGKIAALDALIIQAEVFNHREEPYAATGTAAFYLLKDNEHDAARQLFERCLELGVALDISSNIYFDMFKEKQFESAKVLFDYLDGAHIVDKVPSHSSHHLIVTLLNGGHAESAAVVAETMRVHDLTRALVSLATDSGEDGRPAGEYLESALFLLERIYERGGPYDLSRAVNKAAQFGRYELLDTILNFTHEHGIQVDFDEALRYINAPRSAIIIDISGLNLSHEQIFDKVEEELDREGSMPEDRRLIVSRLRRGQIEQERTGEPEQPEIGHAQREAARTELLRDDWEVNYGLPRKDFPVGLGLAMQDILRSLDVPVRRLEADSITLESVEDLEYIRAQLRGQARCPQSGSGE